MKNYYSALWKQGTFLFWLNLIVIIVIFSLSNSSIAQVKTLNINSYTSLNKQSVDIGDKFVEQNNLLTSPPDIMLRGFEKPYCFGEDVTLRALVAGPSFSVEWIKPDGLPHSGSDLSLGPVNMSHDGIYTISAWYNSSPGNISTITATLTVVQLPEVILDPVTYICSNENYISDAVGLFTEDFLWETSGDGHFLQPDQLIGNYQFGTADLQAGFVTLTLTAFSLEGGMCDPSINDILVMIREAPELEYVITREADCNDQNGSITVIMPGGSAGFEFSINDGASWQSNNHFDGLSSGAYSILAADQNGCRAYYAENPFTLQQLTECDDEVVFPTAFTPDGNGLNDTFYPIWVNSIPAEYSMQVFNRWGELVFETTNPYSGWDGRDNDGLMPAETYGYVVRVKFIHEQGNGFKEQRGVVRLVR